MKSILITGGTGTIGSALVAHFTKEKWNVITVTRDKARLQNLLQKGLLNKDELAGVNVIQTDLSVEGYLEDFRKYFASHPEHMPNVLVNNARSLDNLGVDEKGLSKRDDMLSEYMLNVVVPYELSMYLAGEGNNTLNSIINISSMYGIVPFNSRLYPDYPRPAPIQYSLSKSAVIHLSKELAVRLADKDIRVNTVSYGGVRGRVNEDFEARYAELCPGRSMLEPHQTIGPVDFLASDKSLGVTGHNLVQDGGWTTW